MGWQIRHHAGLYTLRYSNIASCTTLYIVGRYSLNANHNLFYKWFYA